MKILDLIVKENKDVEIITDKSVFVFIRNNNIFSLTKDGKIFNDLYVIQKLFVILKHHLIDKDSTDLTNDFIKFYNLLNNEKLNLTF